MEGDRQETLLRDDDRERIAKLAAEIKRDKLLIAFSLIWLAACIVVSLYIIFA